MKILPRIVTPLAERKSVGVLSVHLQVSVNTSRRSLKNKRILLFEPAFRQVSLNAPVSEPMMYLKPAPGAKGPCGLPSPKVFSHKEAPCL